MPEIKDLQKLIEERASKKLWADIKELGQLLEKQPLLNGPDIPRLYVKWTIPIRTIENAGPTHETRYDDVHPGYMIAFNNYDKPSRYTQLLYDQWIPIYIERESVQFLKDIDDLKAKAGQLETDVQNLLDNQPMYE